MAGGKQRGFVEFSADQLKADGNAASTDSARQDERRMSTQVRRGREAQQPRDKRRIRAPRRHLDERGRRPTLDRHHDQVGAQKQSVDVVRKSEARQGCLGESGCADIGSSPQKSGQLRAVFIRMIRKKHTVSDRCLSCAQAEPGVCHRLGRRQCRLDNGRTEITKHLLRPPHDLTNLAVDTVIDQAAIDRDAKTAQPGGQTLAVGWNRSPGRCRIFGIVAGHDAKHERDIGNRPRNGADMIQ